MFFNPEEFYQVGALLLTCGAAIFAVSRLYGQVTGRFANVCILLLTGLIAGFGFIGAYTLPERMKSAPAKYGFRTDRVLYGDNLLAWIAREFPEATAPIHVSVESASYESSTQAEWASRISEIERRFGQRYIPQYISRAPDEVLLRFWIAQGDVLENRFYRRASSCVDTSYDGSGQGVPRQSANEDRMRLGQLLAEAVRAGHWRPVEPMSDDRIRAATAAIGFAVERVLAGPDKRHVLFLESRDRLKSASKADKQAYCRGWLRLREQIDDFEYSLRMDVIRLLIASDADQAVRLTLQ